MSQYSLLSDKTVLEYMDKGKIVIDPFIEANLNTASYDVTLGQYFYREQMMQIEWGSNIYNIYSEDHVKRVWGNVQEAKPYQYYKDKGIILENIRDDDLIIFIDPGETILAHTNEFIGGINSVTTMMKSRSSSGRNFLELCKCAGLGDVGYINRWTMEITNNSKHFRIPLIVGRRYAQILFLETDGILNKQYDHSGKYQSSSDLNIIKKTWKPEDMLPKMYKDREINK